MTATHFTLTKNYYLYKNFWRFSGAPHEEKPIDEDLALSLLKQGGLLVRNTHGFDCQEDTGFWYVVKDQFGGLEELKPRIRRKVKSAFKHIEYRIETPSFVLQNGGYDIYTAAFNAYKIKEKKLLRPAFEDLFEVQPTECMVCIDKETQKMIGFAINHVWENAVGYEFSAILPEYRHNPTYAYYGLFHARNEHYLQNMKKHYVTDGSRSITEHSGVQDWLIENFGFRKAYCHLDIYYKRWMEAAIKMLYPLRKIITNRRVKAVLNMEAMRRGEK